MTPYNPDDWWDVLGLLITALALIGAAGVPAWINSRRHKGLSAQLGEVKEQVVNNHTSNLRDDIDIIHREIRGVREDVAQLRGEVRDEREARIDADNALNEHIKLEIQRIPE